uniref:Uncharacterized protein n=1 Tax=Arundo donax TaxID=35708 RepID=A0A0A9BMI6_ARUDO
MPHTELLDLNLSRSIKR